MNPSAYLSDNQRLNPLSIFRGSNLPALCLGGNQVSAKKLASIRVKAHLRFICIREIRGFKPKSN